MKYLLFTGLLFIKFSLLPNASLLLWMFISIAVDFVTGFSKAIVLKQARTSNGLRKTVTKFLQYGGAMAVAIILNHAAEQNKQELLQQLLPYFGDCLVGFIIFIEVTSIFENLIAIDSTSTIAKFFFIPVHRILTAQIKRSADMLLPNSPTPNNKE